jgi:hypothetical protein
MAPVVVPTSRVISLPFKLARWWQMGIDCQVSVDFDME